MVVCPSWCCIATNTRHIFRLFISTYIKKALRLRCRKRSRLRGTTGAWTLLTPPSDDPQSQFFLPDLSLLSPQKKLSLQVKSLIAPTSSAISGFSDMLSPKICKFRGAPLPTSNRGFTIAIGSGCCRPSTRSALEKAVKTH